MSCQPWKVNVQLYQFGLYYWMARLPIHMQSLKKNYFHSNMQRSTAVKNIPQTPKCMCSNNK